MRSYKLKAFLNVLLKIKWCFPLNLFKQKRRRKAAKWRRTSSQKYQWPNFFSRITIVVKLSSQNFQVTLKKSSLILIFRCTYFRCSRTTYITYHRPIFSNLSHIRPQRVRENVRHLCLLGLCSCQNIVSLT